jgi:hypothetical protein
VSTRLRIVALVHRHLIPPQTVEEGTDAIVRLATIGKDGPTGSFHDRAGPLPW